MGGSSSKVKELEAEVRALQRQRTQEENIDRRRDFIIEMSLEESPDLEDIEGNEIPKRLNVGLFGIPAVGKTSLLNSLTFALRGKKGRANFEPEAPENFQGGHTMRQLAVRMTDNLRFIDNRGISFLDLKSEEMKKELISQLEGRSSYHKVVDWQKATPSSKQDKEQRIYCTVVVVDSGTSNAVFDGIKFLVSILYEWQGRFPIAVITKVDKHDPEVMRLVRLNLQSLGITHIFEISNITKYKTELSAREQNILFDLMERCFKDGAGIFKLRHAIESQGSQG